MLIEWLIVMKWYETIVCCFLSRDTDIFMQTTNGIRMRAYGNSWARSKREIDFAEERRHDSGSSGG